MLVVFTNCKHIIRTLPELLNDERNPEDVDTGMEDHAYDQLRYACMSRPMPSKHKPSSDTIIQRHKKSLVKRKTTNRARIV